MEIKANLDELTKYLEKVRDNTLFENNDAYEIGRKLHQLVLNGFSSSTNPYGAPWAPIQHRKGEPLLDTLKLFSSIEYTTKKTTQGIQVGIGTDVEYANYHNVGTAHIKQRMFIPTDANKLPDSYNNVIIDIITRKIESAIK